VERAEMKIQLKAVRSILSMALTAAVLCQSCVRNVEPQEEELAEWRDIPIPPIVHMSASALVSDVQGTLFLGTDWGPKLWRSTDSGRTWTEKTLGINPCCGVHSLLVKGGETVFAALGGGGVFISRDRGDSWIQANNHLTDLNIQSLGTAPDGEILAGMSNGGIFRSENDGGVWVEVEGALIGRTVTAFATDSAGIIYAGCWGQGVFLSTDSGRTWMPSSNGLDSLNFYIRCLAIDNEGYILVGTNGGAIYRSAGGGEPWARIDRGAASGSGAILAIATDREGCIFAGTSGNGAIRSRDGGDSWERANIGLQGLEVTSFLCADDLLLAGTYPYGVFRSTDGGMSWSSARDYFPNDPKYFQSLWSPNSLSIDSCGTYYLRNNEFIYRSRDGGETWIRACCGISGSLNCLAIHPNSSILVGTNAGIFISNDSGDSWSRADTFSINSRKVLALEVAGNGAIYGRTDTGVLKSTDGGSSWEYVLNRTAVRSISTGSDGCIYLGTDFEGVIASSDYGSTWRRITDSLRVFSIDADLIGNVLVSYEDGILCSCDRGDTWKVIQGGRGLFWYTVLAAPGGEVALIFDDDGTLRISEDCFSTWRDVPVPYTRASMFLSPDGHLFFSERNQPGLHRSRDALF
jgi:photosystem II stability/assembly factor-like uncharacterized protein